MAGGVLAGSRSGAIAGFQAAVSRRLHMPRGLRRLGVAVTCIVLSLCAGGATAQPSLDEARRATAGALAAERRLAERRIELAAQVQEAERAEAAAIAALAMARQAASAAAAEAAERAEALRPFWPVARRLALWPAETLLAAPVPPEDALRGLAVLRAVWGRSLDNAAAARGAASRATEQAARAAERAASLAAAEASARQAVVRLDQEIAAARALRAGALDAEAAAIARAAAVASRARTLDAAVERVARPTPAAAASIAAPPSAPPASRAPHAAPHAEPVASSSRGALPVVGSIERGFGDPGIGGPAQGLTLAAAPGARVVAPCAGRAVFAGPFRSYGRLLIVDCGGGLHAVVGGLARLDTEAGSRLLAGEPVGILGPDAPARLYVELRRGGEPVDPRPFLANRADTGRGRP